MQGNATGYASHPARAAREPHITTTAATPPPRTNNGATTLHPHTSTTLTGPDLDYACGHQDGYTAGWHAALTHSADLELRDERLARRIVALLLQHDYNHALVESVLATVPYAQRGIGRVIAS